VPRRADDDAAEHVDGGDDQARDGVAAHKLRGTVHGAEEGAFLFQLAAAQLRFLFVDDAGGQVGIDRHLLAGDGVEGEARADFRDTRGALGDHQEVHRDQDQEHDGADDEVAAHDEVGEAGDHVTRRLRALSTVRQDEPRRRDIQRQAQHGDDEQNGRERREIERPLDPQRHHQDEHRERNGDGQAQIDDDRRQRQEQHDQNEDDAGCKADIARPARFDFRSTAKHGRRRRHRFLRSLTLATPHAPCGRLPLTRPLRASPINLAWSYPTTTAARFQAR
jgi:hypothetical protein